MKTKNEIIIESLKNKFINCYIKRKIISKKYNIKDSIEFVLDFDLISFSNKQYINVKVYNFNKNIKSDFILEFKEALMLIKHNEFKSSWDSIEVIKL